MEGRDWGEAPPNSSNLIQKIYAIRKKKIKDLDIEDLRIMIGQNESLNILMPIAMKILSSNFLAEGDYYEGDLLKNVLTVDKSFWKNNAQVKAHLIDLFEANKESLMKFDTTEEIKEFLFQAYQNFLD
jgi:hypothetical protein